MNTARLFVAFGIVAITAMLWGQYKQISLQKQVIQAQAIVTEQLQAGINSIKEINEENRSQISALLYAQEQVQSHLTARNLEIRKLQNEVKEVRDWANQPLPVDIKRLLKLPPAKGASDYSATVQPGDSMHNAGDKPKK